MTDSTLERVRDARKTISNKCDFDSRKLVAYYQSREKSENARKVKLHAKTDGRSLGDN